MNTLRDRLVHRLAHVTLVASVIAAALVMQPAHGATPVTRVIQLPTVVVVAKRVAVVELERVIVVGKRLPPAVAYASERPVLVVAPKVEERV